MINGHEVREGDWLSLNGSTGEIIAGKQPLAPAELSGDMGAFMQWVDQRRTIGACPCSLPLVVCHCLFIGEYVCTSICARVPSGCHFAACSWSRYKQAPPALDHTVKAFLALTSSRTPIRDPRSA